VVIDPPMIAVVAMLGLSLVGSLAVILFRARRRRRRLLAATRPQVAMPFATAGGPRA
jgi:hypothetical protein